MSKVIPLRKNTFKNARVASLEGDMQAIVSVLRTESPLPVDMVLQRAAELVGARPEEMTNSLSTANTEGLAEINFSKGLVSFPQN
jgi:hypothetical protein